MLIVPIWSSICWKYTCLLKKQGHMTAIFLILLGVIISLHTENNLNAEPHALLHKQSYSYFQNHWNRSQLDNFRSMKDCCLLMAKAIQHLTVSNTGWPGSFISMVLPRKLEFFNQMLGTEHRQACSKHVLLLMEYTCQKVQIHSFHLFIFKFFIWNWSAPSQFCWFLLLQQPLVCSRAVPFRVS